MPLLGKVPLTMPLREQADAGTPLVVEDPDDPAAQAMRQTARGVIAITPMELPVLQQPDARAAAAAGHQAGGDVACRWPARRPSRFDASPGCPGGAPLRSS